MKDRNKALSPIRKQIMDYVTTHPEVSLDDVRKFYNSELALYNIGYKTLWNWVKKARGGKVGAPAKPGQAQPAPALSLEDAIDQWTVILNTARRVGELEAENYRLKNANAALKNEVNILREQAQRRNQQSQQYRRAVQAGEVNLKEVQNG